MRLTIYAENRAMALMALELADKACDRVRDQLDKLQIDDMAVRAMQELFGSLRVALQDGKKIEHDWDFAHRRALGIALLFYKAEVNKRRTGEEKLLIDTAEIVAKLREISALLEELSGQDSLFPGRSLSWTDPKGAKPLTDDEEDDDEDDDAQLALESGSERAGYQELTNATI